jgi:hypothetical protein
MDYLYDELSADEKSEMESILAEDTVLKGELNELEKTRKLLQMVPDEKQQKPLVILPSENQYSRKESASTHVMGLPAAAVTALSIAASILIILFGSSLAGLQVSSNTDGFRIDFGNSAALSESSNDGNITDEDLENLVEQIRTENSLLISAMMNDLQRQQRQQLQEAIRVLNTYYEQQREEDLTIIADGMNQLQVETAYKFLQTDETIEDIIYALNNQ